MERGAGGSYSKVSNIAGQRLSNQIARAYRGTFGARSGLQVVVRQVTEQMLRAGASPAVVSRTLTHYVMDRSALLVAEPQTAASAGFDVRTLVELTAQCVADVALDVRTKTPARHIHSG